MRDSLLKKNSRISYCEKIKRMLQKICIFYVLLKNAWHNIFQESNATNEAKLLKIFILS